MNISKAEKWQLNVRFHTSPLIFSRMRSAYCGPYTSCPCALMTSTRSDQKLFKKWSVRMMAFLVTKGTGFFDETLPWNPSLVRQRLIQPAIDGQVLIRNKTKWLQWLTWDTNSWWWSYQLLPEPEVSVMYCLLWNRSARGPWNSGKWSWSTSTPNNLSNVCRKCATHNAL